MSFADLGISKPVVGALAKRDISQPFPVQEMVIRDALAGHDLLVQSPTGSGKTLAFGVALVALLERGGGQTPRPASSPARWSMSSPPAPPPASCGSPPSAAGSASARRSPRRNAPTSSSPP